MADIKLKNGAGTEIVYNGVDSILVPAASGSTPVEFTINTIDINGLINRTISTITSTASVIGSYAFYNCSALTTVNFPLCTTIGSSVFYKCGLTSISFPECTRLYPYAFYNCNTLSSITLPKCKTIDSYAVGSMSALQQVYFPLCSLIGGYAFVSDKNLTAISFPVCQSISNAAFRDCTNLLSADFPLCSIIGNTAFSGCKSLSVASFPACTGISANAFMNCSNLFSLYLLGSSVPQLQDSSATFRGSPISTSHSGVYGSIFVASSLLSAFQTASKWSYFADRFVGI